MKKIALFFIAMAICLIPVNIQAEGISVDAGLQPPQDRWIIRTMAMYMRRKDDPTPMSRKMDKVTLNTVLAYGLRRDLTLMIKQPFIYTKMSMNGSSEEKTGAGDLSVLAKYGLLRRNTPNHTVGISGIFGVEPPTGSEAFTTDTWGLKTGIYASWRKAALASDLNITYTWNDFVYESKNDVGRGDELSIDTSLAYQFSFGEAAEVSLTPIMEVSFKQFLPDRLNGQKVSDTGELVLFVSPGLKLTRSSFILEGLFQIPIWQDQQGRQTKRDTGFILGTRYMF